MLSIQYLIEIAQQFYKVSIYSSDAQMTLNYILRNRNDGFSCGYIPLDFPAGYTGRKILLETGPECWLGKSSDIVFNERARPKKEYKLYVYIYIKFKNK